MISTQNYPIVNQPFLYVNGLQISNDATTPNTVIDINSGQCRDSNNIVDMVLSNPITINSAVNGVNGLDTGVLLANSFYRVFMISDSRGFNPTGAILTLDPNANPLMPLGYDSFRRIGFASTAVSTATFLILRQIGNNSERLYQWDVPVNVINSGTATTFTNVSLANGIPLGLYAAYLQCSYVPNATHYFSIRPFGSSAVQGDCQIVLNSNVAGVELDLVPFVMIPGLNGSVPTIQYAINTTAGQLTIDVTGWQDSL